MKPTYEELEVEVAFLKAEIAKLKYALTGRTMSCELCNNTARERDKYKADCEQYKRNQDAGWQELIATKQERDKMRALMRTFVEQENKFASKAFCSTTITYGQDRPAAWKRAFKAMEDVG